MRSILSCLLSLCLLVPAAAVKADIYEIDAAHSSVSFKVRHMMISWTKGEFKDFSGKFSFDEKTKKGNTKAVIQAASIDTGNEARDNHLRGPDFFDAKKFPTIEFLSGKVKILDKKTAKLKGRLTIRGVTKPVELIVTYHGTATDPWGNERAGFTATTLVDRMDFGVSWNKVLDKGGLTIGEKVHVTLEIEGIKKKPGAKKKTAGKKR